jgi:hypothetical protein
MAKPILEVQALDFHKGFVVGYYDGDRYADPSQVDIPHREGSHSTR